MSRPLGGMRRRGSHVGQRGGEHECSRVGGSDGDQRLYWSAPAGGPTAVVAGVPGVLRSAGLSLLSPLTTERSPRRGRDSSSICGSDGAGGVWFLGPIQAKLTVGAVDDLLERAADKVAGRVMRMPDPEVLGSARQVRPIDGESEEELQRSPGGVSPVVSEDARETVHEVLRTTMDVRALDNLWGRAVCPGDADYDEVGKL